MDNKQQQLQELTLSNDDIQMNTKFKFDQMLAKLSHEELKSFTLMMNEGKLNSLVTKEHYIREHITRDTIGFMV